MLGDRDLRTHVMSVLYTDDKNYENPADYIKRNAYFFTNQLPPVSAGESKIPVAELKSAVAEMMTELSLSETLVKPSGTTKPETYAAQKASLDFTADIYTAAIEMCCAKRAPGDDDEAKALLKEWRKGVHRYLREKLTFGMPGPSSSQVMAVLGYKECCWRIGGN